MARLRLVPIGELTVDCGKQELVWELAYLPAPELTKSQTPNMLVAGRVSCGSLLARLVDRS
jgi:hypothetical protein